MSGVPSIRVDGVSHAYGATRALDGVSMNVPAGAVVGLVGPNGAGKTTLMRAIVTLLRPDAGHIAVGGHDVARAAGAVRALVGFLPERAQPYGELLAWEHLDFFAEVAGHGRAERERRVAAALAHVGLAARRDTPVAHLSKGLRQRLALRAALMHDPKVLVLDEPTDGLDPESRAQVLDDVRRAADGGCAVLLSSHVLDEVEQVSDRTVVLVQGRVTEERAPEGVRYAVRVRGDPEAARAQLAGRADVAAVAIEGGRLLVDLCPGVADAADLAAALVGAGVALVELREERVTLRERFRRAVRGGDAPAVGGGDATPAGATGGDAPAGAGGGA